MGRYQVAPNTQVNKDGRLYEAGETVVLDDGEAAPLVAAGTVVVPVKAPARPVTKKAG